MQLKWCKGALISANDAEIKANRTLRCSDFITCNYACVSVGGTNATKMV